MVSEPEDENVLKLKTYMYAQQTGGSKEIPGICRVLKEIH